MVLRLKQGLPGLQTNTQDHEQQHWVSKGACLVQGCAFVTSGWLNHNHSVIIITYSAVPVWSDAEHREGSAYQSPKNWTHRNERSDRCKGRGGRGGFSGGRGGFSGGRCSLSVPSGPSTAMLRPPEALLLVDVFLRCVKSDRLEERECSVL